MSDASDRPAATIPAPAYAAPSPPAPPPPAPPSRPWVDPAAVMIGLGAAVLFVALYWLLATPRPDGGAAYDPARMERLEARILAAEGGREQVASLEGRVRQLTAIDTAAQQVPAIEGRVRAAEGLAERAASAERRLQALEGRPAFDPAQVVARADLLAATGRLDSESQRSQAAQAEAVRRLDALTQAQEAAVQTAREGIETRAAALAEQTTQRLAALDGTVGQRTTALEQGVGQRVGALEQAIAQRVGAAEQQVGGRLEAIDRRLATIEQTVAQRVAAAEQAATQRATAAEQAAERRAAALTERLATLEQEGGRRLDALDRGLAERAAGERAQTERTAALERAASERIAAAEQAATQRLAALEQAVTARTAALEAAQQRVASVEQRNARLAAVDALRNALDGGRPLGPSLPRVGDPPPALARFASQAPPTLAQLRAGFEEALRRARLAADAAAAPDGQAPSATEQALGRVGALLSVRRGNELVWGEAAAEDIENARRALAAGDLEGTLAPIEKLPPAARDAMAEWTGQARTLIEARAALARLTAG